MIRPLSITPPAPIEELSDSLSDCESPTKQHTNWLFPNNQPFLVGEAQGADDREESDEDYPEDEKTTKLAVKNPTRRLETSRTRGKLTKTTSQTRRFPL